MKKNKNIMVRAIFAMGILIAMLSAVFASAVFADVSIQSALPTSTANAVSVTSESAPIVIVGSTLKLSRYIYVNVGDKFEMSQGQSAIVQDEGNINILLSSVEYIYSTTNPVDSASDTVSTSRKAYVGISVTKPTLTVVNSAVDAAIPSVMPVYDYEYKLFPGESVTVFGGLKITLLGISNNKAAFQLSSSSTEIPPTSTAVSVKLGQLFKLNEEQTANVVDTGMSISLKDIQEGYRCPKTTLTTSVSTTSAAENTASTFNTASEIAMPIGDGSDITINCYDALATLKVSTANTNAAAESANNLEVVYTVKLSGSINIGDYTISFKDYSGNTGAFIVEKNSAETITSVQLGDKFEMQFGDKVALKEPTYIELGFININKVQSILPVDATAAQNSIISTTTTAMPNSIIGTADSAVAVQSNSDADLNYKSALKVTVTDKNVICAQAAEMQVIGNDCGIIRSATVVLEDENGNVIGKDSTNNGAAVFYKLEEGLYVAKVYADGYIDAKAEKKVRAGQGEYLYINLQPTQDVNYYYKAVISVSLPPQSAAPEKYRIISIAQGDVVQLYGNVGLTLLNLNAEKNTAVFSFIKLGNADLSSSTELGVISSSTETNKGISSTTSVESSGAETASAVSQDNKCLQVGIRSKEADTNAVFCDSDGKAKEQKQEGVECQNNFECQSNSCMSNQCVDLNKKLDENLNLMNKLVAWLKNIFG